MATIYDIPKDILTYLFMNILDSDDVKTLLITSKIFRIIKDNNLKEIKKIWRNKYVENFLKYKKEDKNYEYLICRKIYGKIEGYYKKKFKFEKNFPYNYFFCKKVIKTKYLNDILDGKYTVYFKHIEIETEYDELYKPYNIITESRLFECELFFKEENLISFEIIINKNLLINQKGIHKLNYNLEKNPKIEELLLILELKEEYSKQIKKQLYNFGLE